MLVQLPVQFNALMEQVPLFIAARDRFNELPSTRFAHIESLMDAVGKDLTQIKNLNAHIKSRLDTISDTLGRAKGNHTRDIAVKRSPIIAIDLGLQYARNLTKAELVPVALGASGATTPNREPRSLRRG